MSGHSKWSTIKHRKGAADSRRGKLFTKLIKEITVAAALGGGNPESNPRLRAAVIKARAANMPKDNIERSIKKGTGEGKDCRYFELQYEAYAPGGVALLIEALSENKNRTAAEVRSILNKANGYLGPAAFHFERKGVISYDLKEADNPIQPDLLLETSLEANAENIEETEEMISVYMDPNSFASAVKELEEKGFQHSSAEIDWIPLNPVQLDQEAAGKVLELIDKLEDLDDIQNVASNLELPEDFQYESS